MIAPVLNTQQPSPLERTAYERAILASYGDDRDTQRYAQGFIAGALGDCIPAPQTDATLAGYTAGTRHARRTR